MVGCMLPYLVLCLSSSLNKALLGPYFLGMGRVALGGPLRFLGIFSLLEGHSPRISVLQALLFGSFPAGHAGLLVALKSNDSWRVF